MLIKGIDVPIPQVLRQARAAAIFRRIPGPFRTTIAIDCTWDDPGSTSHMEIVCPACEGSGWADFRLLNRCSLCCAFRIVPVSLAEWYEERAKDQEIPLIENMRRFPMDRRDNILREEEKRLAKLQRAYPEKTIIMPEPAPAILQLMERRRKMIDLWMERKRESG